MAFALKELTIVKAEQTCSYTLLTQDDKGGACMCGGGRWEPCDGGAEAITLIESEVLLNSTPCHSIEFPHSFQPLMYY